MVDNKLWKIGRPWKTCQSAISRTIISCFREKREMNMEEIEQIYGDRLIDYQKWV